MRNWLLIKWDWMVYWWAMKSLRRICDRDPGHAYLMELWLKDWRKDHQISPSVQRATELFFDALQDLRKI